MIKKNQLSSIFCRVFSKVKITIKNNNFCILKDIFYIHLIYKQLSC